MFVTSPGCAEAVNVYCRYLRLVIKLLLDKCQLMHLWSQLTCSGSQEKISIKVTSLGGSRPLSQFSKTILSFHSFERMYKSIIIVIIY